MEIEQSDAATASDGTAPSNGGPAQSPSSGSPAGGRGGFAVLRVLRHREFAIFWAGQGVSLVGTSVQGITQGWVVTNLTKTAIALGLVHFLLSLPTLLLMPIGGMVADRMERRQILIYSQWLMLVLSLIMGTLVVTGNLQLWHVYLIAIPMGVATAFELPAYQSFFPQLVEKEDLTQAISLNQATFHGSRVLGPALASVFVALWGTAAAFFANAASFAGVIVSLFMIKRRPPASDDRKSSARNFMGEGLRYVKERPALQSLLGLTAITSTFIFPNLAVLMPFYTKHIIHSGAGGLGWIMGVSGGGSMVGSMMMLSVPTDARMRRIAICTAATLVTISVMAWSQSLWLSVAACGVQSFAIAHSLGLVSVIIQEEVPNALRGRVMSIYSLTFMGVMPFAALLIPGVVDAVGMRVELQGAGILYAIASAWLLLRLHRATRSAAQPGEADAGA